MKAEASVRPTHVGLLVAIVLLGASLRLYGIDADSLWLDEILTANRAQLDLPALLSSLASGEGRGVQLPLMYVVTHFFVAGLGISEFILRLPSMLFGSLSVLLVYKAGEELWSRDEGLLAALLLAFNPYHVQYSQEARHYALMVFLALLSLIFLIKAIRGNARALWVGFVVSTVLGLYNHYFAYLFLAVELVLAVWLIAEDWSLHRARGGAANRMPRGPGTTPARQALALLLSLLVVGFCLLPWASPFQAVFTSPAGSGQLGPSAANLVSSLSFVGKVLVSYSNVPGWAIALWLGLFLLGWARSGAKAIVLVALSIGIPLVFLTLLDPSHVLMPKYVLFWLPLYLLAVAMGVTTATDVVHRLVQRHLHRKWWSPAVARTLAALLVLALGMVPLRDYYRWEKEDWRSAAQYLHDNAAQDDIVIVDGQRYDQGGDSQRTLEALSFYMSLGGQDAITLQAQRGLAESVEQLPAAGAGVWGVLWHVDDLRRPAQLGDEVEIIEFPNVALVRLPKAGGDSLGNTASILEALALVQPLTAGRFDLHMALAELYQGMGKTAQATSQATLAGQVAAEYEREIGLDPNSPIRGWDWKPYWDLASTYENLGMLQEATTAYEQAFTLNPSLVPACLKLGSLYRQLNQPAKARSVYLHAVELDPENKQLYLLLGETYQGLGRIEDATLAYQEALSIDPADEWASLRLSLLSPPDVHIPHPLLHSFNLEVALLGYDLQPGTLEPGDTVALTLWWQAVANMDKDYTVFIHLTVQDGRVRAQEDRLLLLDDRPTSSWRLGLVVKDEYHLQLPPDATPGQYSLTMGVYYWETGERLPVWNEDGHRLAGDIVQVQSMSVGG